VSDALEATAAAYDEIAAQLERLDAQARDHASRSVPRAD
jgi:hypothetical protein